MVIFHVVSRYLVDLCFAIVRFHVVSLEACSGNINDNESCLIGIMQSYANPMSSRDGVGIRCKVLLLMVDTVVTIIRFICQVGATTIVVEAVYCDYLALHRDKLLTE